MSPAIQLSDIKIGDRTRKDMGDITALAKSMDEVGLLHPVVVTADHRLIAGQRRIAAARMLGWDTIDAHVVTLENLLLGERDENTVRKDFTPSEAVALAEALAPIEREAAAQRRATLNNAETASENFSEARGRAEDKVALAVGMSRPTYAKAKAVVEAARDDPDAFGDLVTDMDKRGKVSYAFQELLKRRYATQPAPALPTGRYRVFYADPPWAYGNTMPDYMGVQDDHYPIMSMDALCALPIKSMAEDNAVLFLWVTSPILHDCFRLIDAWGFEYKASFVWDKVKHVMGHYNSVRHELLLVCVRGSCQPDIHKLFDSVVTEERTEHSRKPGVFYEIIDTLYPNGARIELFAREKIEGWDVYGNELS